MRIECPYCKAVLGPKGLRPGRFQPKCPGCAKSFVLLVPDKPTGGVRVQRIATDTDVKTAPKVDPNVTGS
jgi:eukaryotic-like serine/threonine-protein kinase